MRIYSFARPGAPLSAEDVKDPIPTGREVLVRITHSGVCHTDTHVQEGGYDLGEAGFMSLADRGVPYPIVAGHEIVGEVESVGDGVTDVKPGDRRLVYPWVGCRACSLCATGRENLCPQGRALGVFRPGGFAEKVLVPHEEYLIDIEGIDPEWAATLACSGLTAFSSVNKVLPDGDGATIVVIGAGGVGLMALATLRALGHDRVCVVDVNDESLEIARGLGATVVVNTATAQVPLAALLEATGGPVAAVVDFVNSGATGTLAFNALAKNGRLVQVGLFGGDMRLPTALVAIKGLHIQGNYVGNLDELRAVVRLARTGQLPRIPITTAPLNEQQITSSLTALTEGRVRGRTVLLA